MGHGMLDLSLGLLGLFICILGGGMKLPRKRTHLSGEFFRGAVLLRNQIRLTFSTRSHVVQFHRLFSPVIELVGYFIRGQS